MADRLRELIDLVLASLDEPGADGRVLAERAHFSRDHLDRLLAAATGESPIALRRRLLLERAAWQLRVTGAAPSAVAGAAGYGSLAAFSRAFSRAYGVAPSAFAGADLPLALPAPNEIRFHPPAGLLIPGAGEVGAPPRRDLTDRLLAHHHDRTRELLTAVVTLTPQERVRRLRPGFVVAAFEGEESCAQLMAQRLVRMPEVWVAAMTGLEAPPSATASDAVALADDPADLLQRFERSGRAFSRAVRVVRERGAWDDAFVDALCEPPHSFTYGGVVSHVLTYGAIRREALAGVLAELGVRDLASGDPIDWE
ncbi:AraC family transcriptional regulator [Conexibacter stalactiti]|uniref:AraC family transcriptional regulator n=1 Tax=Conexibacter stalactiti TaxID=1940611 RepID=A0ABU4HSM2_9ACTN|nr:AraC family transcriptional regulator [Conexibacter stalactiti]MDW5595535.1 AraC family transcriptional regulator [Conexibacter stalactiti]MEC5036177.1 AraC family transcriptional regulator [Conexibacter stalactiti]